MVLKKHVVHHNSLRDNINFLWKGYPFGWFFCLASFSTYAYFIAQSDTALNNSVRVQTSPTDNLSFSMESSINLTADQSSFASGKGNVTGSTTAKFNSY